MIRHGEALHNVHPELWKYDNESMFGLTLNGVLQAHNLGKLLAGNNDTYTRVVVEHSPSIRTLQTASIISKELNRQGIETWFQPNSAVREIGTAYHPDFVYEEFANDPYYRKDNGESFHQRFTQYKERGCVNYQPRGALHLVVSHLHAMNAIIAFELYRTGQVSEEEALKFHRMLLPHCVPLELTGVFDHAHFVGWRVGPMLQKFLPDDIQWDERHAHLQQIAVEKRPVVSGSGV